MEEKEQEQEILGKKLKRAKVRSLKSHLLRCTIISLVTVSLALTCFFILYSKALLDKEYREMCDRSISGFGNVISEKIEYPEKAIKLLSELLAATYAEDAMVTMQQQGIDTTTAIAVFDAKGDVVTSCGAAILSIDQLKQLHGSDGVQIVNGHLYSVHSEKCSRVGHTSCEVIVATQLDSQSMVEELKPQYGADFQVFVGNQCTASTIEKQVIKNAAATMRKSVQSKVLQNGSSYSSIDFISWAKYRVSVEPIKDASGNVVGAYFAGHNMVVMTMNRVLMMCCSVVVGAICCVLSASFVTKKLKVLLYGPMSRVAEFCQEVASGNLGMKQQLSEEYEYVPEDELGQLFGVVKGMVNTLQGYITEIAKVFAGIANGDLTVKVDGNYSGDFEQIKDSMVQTLNQLNKDFKGLKESAGNLDSSSVSLSSDSQMLAQGTAQQSSAVEQLNATIEAVYEDVVKNAELANTATEQANGVEEKMTRTSKETEELVCSINQINDVFRRMMAIVKTVQDISFQTNILALNAAVEAARAGEAGKGFNVVADEVRTLATNSAASAKDIELLITEAGKVVTTGTDTAKRTAEGILSMTESVNSVVAAIENISEGSNRQSTSINEIRLGIDQISQAVSSMSVLAEKTAATSSALGEQSSILKEMCNSFNVSE